MVDGRNRAGMPAPPVRDPEPCLAAVLAVPACLSGCCSARNPCQSPRRRPLSIPPKGGKQCPCLFNFPLHFHVLLKGQSQFQSQIPPCPISFWILFVLRYRSISSFVVVLILPSLTPRHDTIRHYHHLLPTTPTEGIQLVLSPCESVFRSVKSFTAVTSKALTPLFACSPLSHCIRPRTGQLDNLTVDS